MASFERTITGAKAVQDVMNILGITPPSVIAGSQDATAKQLWVLASQVGQRLLDENDWETLTREHTITTVPGTSAYNLPTDFKNYISDSQWNRTTRMPVIGHLREYEWEMLKARNLSGTTFTLLFRIDQEQVVFYDTPTTVQTIVLPYTSRSWVREVALTFRDNLNVDDDVVMYDSQLFKLALQLEWLAEKRFDTTRPQALYDSMLEKAKSKDVPGRTLTLASRGGYPYLGVLNIPSSGYGS